MSDSPDPRQLSDAFADYREDRLRRSQSSISLDLLEEVRQEAEDTQGMARRRRVEAGLGSFLPRNRAEWGLALLVCLATAIVTGSSLRALRRSLAPEGGEPSASEGRGSRSEPPDSGQEAGLDTLIGWLGGSRKAAAARGAASGTPAAARDGAEADGAGLQRAFGAARLGMERVEAVRLMGLVALPSSTGPETFEGSLELDGRQQRILCSMEEGRVLGLSVLVEDMPALDPVALRRRLGEHMGAAPMGDYAYSKGRERRAVLSWEDGRTLVAVEALELRRGLRVKRIELLDLARLSSRSAPSAPPDASRAGAG